MWSALAAAPLFFSTYPQASHIRGASTEKKFLGRNLIEKHEEQSKGLVEGDRVKSFFSSKTITKGVVFQTALQYVQNLLHQE